MTWTFTEKRAEALREARKQLVAANAERKRRWTLGASQKMGRYAVYRAADGRPFVLSKRVDGVVTRKFGETDVCETCGKPMFRLPTGRAGRWTNCSTKCGGKKLRLVKRANSIAKGGPSKNQLDRWFSLIIRAAGVCARCGSVENLQCAHIVSRRYTGTRHSLDNAVCLCAGCHMFMTYRPLEWEAWVEERIGVAALSDIKRRARDFNGTYDRVAAAMVMYAEAERLGITAVPLVGAGAHMGWKGLRDPDALRSERATA